jgi:hypothetical protein
VSVACRVGAANRRALLLAATLLAWPGAATGQREATGSSASAQVSFVEISREAGVNFRHTNGASADKHLVETMGSGGVLFDFDDDGWLDLFLVDGGSLADPRVARQASHRLYRNSGGARFEDVTARSGIRHVGYGMGACAGDYDNDGRVDLYVTSFGTNTLYRNLGHGAFDDVTREARVGTPLWSVGCAFTDIDRDGDLDLFVVNYVEASADRTPFCGNARLRLRFYCHPLNYDPLPNTLYRNDGNAGFTDISTEAGIAAHRGNGLGVVATDVDEDGWPDLFVANDSVPNFLFRNRDGRRFEEVGLRSGVAVATDGQARAGMGVDAGDVDGDGRAELVVTNLDFETHSLFRGLGRGLFSDATVETGIGVATLPFVGFGVVFLDVDHDGHLDIVVANGHIMDNAPQYRAGATYAQRNLLLHNRGGRFRDLGPSAGPGFAIEKVSRGLASGDIDNDGDLDLLVTNSGQSIDLLRNDGGERLNSVFVRLVGMRSNRDGIGARIALTAGGRTQVREVKAGSSYLSQNDTRVHFGLGVATLADRLEVRWPSGQTETLRDLPAGRILTIREGKGLARAAPFVR